jgi:hypothetical protein
MGPLRLRLMRTCYERWELCLPVTMLCLKTYIKAMQIKNMEYSHKRTFLFLLWVLPFLLVDIIYNFTVGVYIFKSFPKIFSDKREVLLTYVVKRIEQSGTPEQKRVSGTIKELLNSYDEGHI